VTTPTPTRRPACPHGTYTGYNNHRCRCEPCREAKRVYVRNRRPKRACSLEDCPQPHAAKGYCRSHYRAWKLYGDPRKLQPWGQKGCSITGCNRRHRCRGLCAAHYEMSRRIKAEPLQWDRKRPRLPAAPLHDVINARAAAGRSAAEIARALGLKTERNLYDLLKRDEVREADADRYATALGLHMDILWPSDEVAA